MTQSTQVYAQGDILIVPIADHTRSSKARDIHRDPDGHVLGRGELSGHRHILLSEAAEFYREADIPSREATYVGHLVLGAEANLCHEEHAAIRLSAGSYVVRRQRVFDPGLATRMLLAGD